MTTTKPSDTEYWFARRYPIGSISRSMAPVHWKGWLVVAGFVTCLMLGGVAFAWFGAHDRMAMGIALFALAAFIGGLWFISVTRVRGDPIRTVADYKRDKPSV
ncbi:MAG: hypothetical protein DCF16_14550 [Alphaproteobacteria bacterium]|nr:MAG: hypothetical protein DCF16_14550 [Alphaproteobacteria bacterium]